MWEIINGDATEVMKTIETTGCVIVTDPPFNIGYHYATYKDNLPEHEYLDMLSKIFGGGVPLVLVQYPEMLYKIAQRINRTPDRVVSWVYNSNTRRQHRDIAFFGITPDFSKVTQPYKNPKDKRVRKLIESGKTGCKLYDWWDVNQVKNVSKEKTEHPCQMPIEVMDRVIGILPDGIAVVDPFCGSGTTGVSCIKRGIDFIGIEIDRHYADIAKNRLQEALDFEGEK